MFMNYYEKLNKLMEDLNVDDNLTTKKIIKEDAVDIVSMDIPLLTRILEYFNENKMDDVKLHVILTNIINESKKTSPLNINNYENIINGGKNE